MILHTLSYNTKFYGTSARLNRYKSRILARFSTLSGTGFISFYIIWQQILEIFYHLRKKKPVTNVKFCITKRACFKHSGLCHMTYGQIILHVCKRKNLVIIVLHWKHATSCDKSCFVILNIYLCFHIIFSMFEMSSAFCYIAQIITLESQY